MPAPAQKTPIRTSSGTYLLRVSVLLLLAAVAALLAPSGASADPPTVYLLTDVNPDTSTVPQPADADSGGRVNGLAVDPADNQIAYAGSEWGGLYKTTDGGATWTRLNGHRPNALWDVAVNPRPTCNDGIDNGGGDGADAADPDCHTDGNETNAASYQEGRAEDSGGRVVYATSFYDGRVPSEAGINVSYDGGSTWMHPVVPDVANCTASAAIGLATIGVDSAGWGEPSAFGIGIAPDVPNKVWIGTKCGIAHTTDSGANWTHVDPDPSTRGGRIWDVVAQARGIVDICGDDGHFRSIDGGITWQDLDVNSGNQLPSLASTDNCSIAASPLDPDVLFVTAGRRLWESDDGGRNWTVVMPLRGSREPFVVTRLADTNIERGDQCNNRTDDDGDTLINDGCPAVGTGGEDRLQCGSDGTGNGIDDDADTTVDDGCDGGPGIVGNAQPEVTNTCTNATDDDDLDGRINDGCPAQPAANGAPEAGANCGDGVDDDADTVPDDGCSESDGSADGGPDCADAQDDDGDGYVNDGCPAFDNPDLPNNTQTETSEAPGGDVNQCNDDLDGDRDGSAFAGRYNDGCPASAFDLFVGDGFTLVRQSCQNALPGVDCPAAESDQCANPADDDGDGTANDGCGGAAPPAVGVPEVDQCQNPLDDDGDGAVNDGCPSDGSPESGAQCNNATDDDDGGGGPVNEGCPARMIAAGTGAHADSGDLEFDPTTAIPQCPLFYSNDGGVYKSNDCGATWTRSMVGIHAQWLWDMDGAALPGGTGIYTGTQDVGGWFSTDGGTTWANPECCDVFDVVTDGNVLLYTTCCFTQQSPATRLFSRPANNPTAAPTPLIDNNNLPPSGWLMEFQQADSIDTFGPGDFVFVTKTNANFDANGGNGAGGVFITQNTFGSTTQLGAASTPPGACGVQASGPAANPTFYVLAGPPGSSGPLECRGGVDNDRDGQMNEDPVDNLDTDADGNEDGTFAGPGLGNCNDGVDNDGGDGADAADPDCAPFIDEDPGAQLWKYSGLAAGGTWTRADSGLHSVGVFDVDPTDPNLLYASELTPTGPQMMKSTDGGANWSPDATLDTLMAGNGSVKAQTASGPLDFITHGVYEQPTLVEFSPHDDTLLAGGRDSGLMISRDNGATWQRITLGQCANEVDNDGDGTADDGCPGGPAAVGPAEIDDNLPRPWHAYFDPSGDTYVGTQGRGVWKFTAPVIPAGVVEEGVTCGVANFFSNLARLAPEGAELPHLDVLGNVLPFLNNSLTGANGLRLAAVLTELQNRVNNTVDDINDFLQNLRVSFTIDGVNVIVDADVDVQGDLLSIGLTIRLARLSNADLDLGEEADQAGLTVEGAVPVLLTLLGEFTLEFDQSLYDDSTPETIAETCKEATSVVASITLGAAASTNNLLVEGRLGFARITTDDLFNTPNGPVEGAQIAVDASISVALDDPNDDGRTTVAEIENTDLGDLIDVTPHGHIFGSIPVRTNLFDVTRPETDQCGNGIDDDNDGAADDGCGGASPAAVGDPEVNQCQNDTDDDGDDKVNDGCPEVTASSETDQCANDTDDDGDGKVNDGCAARGEAESSSLGLCDNAVDDDNDGKVNDGCPQEGGSAETDQCDNATDDDGDGSTNDGCPPSSPRIDFAVSLNPGEPVVEFHDFGALNPFNNMSNLSFLTAVGELLDWLKSLQNTGVLDTKLPFTDATLSDVVVVADKLQTALATLFGDDASSVQFSDPVEFKDKFETALEIVLDLPADSLDIPLDYDPVKKQLTFDLNLSDSFSAGETSTNEGVVGSCADGLDNSGDGAADKADADCHTDGDINNVASYDPTRDEDGVSDTCDDGKDNDGDGDIDENDTQCRVGLEFGDQLEVIQGVQVQAGASVSFDTAYDLDLSFGIDLSDFPTEDGAGEGSCFDGVDNGTEGPDPLPADGADENDSECTAAIAELFEGPDCGDGEDNDSNGDIDSADPQCHTDGNAGNADSYDPLRREDGAANTCTDGIDNDGDLFSDLADGDCALTLEDRLFIATDGTGPELKLDLQFEASSITASAMIGMLEVGVTDGSATIGASEDPDAANPSPDCNDGIDNDGNGDTDSDDPDCHVLLVDLKSPTGRITLPRAIESLGTMSNLVDAEINAFIEGDLTVDAIVSGVSLTGGTGGTVSASGGVHGALALNGSEDGAGPDTCTDGIDNGGGDGADEEDTDCNPLVANLQVDLSGLNQLLNFNTEDPLALLIRLLQVIDAMAEQMEGQESGALGQPLPVVGTSVADVFSYAGELADLLEGAQVAPETDCNDTQATATPENPIDDDHDGFPNDGCPISGEAPEVGAQCENDVDDDIDGKVNDGCPIAQPSLQLLEEQIEGLLGLLPETTCADGVDNGDSDGADASDDDCHSDNDANDGDDTYDSTLAEDGVDNCANSTDDDNDAVVNDGCPQVGSTAESGAECDNDINDDAADDSAVNDGCPDNLAIELSGSDLLFHLKFGAKASEDGSLNFDLSDLGVDPDLLGLETEGDLQAEISGVLQLDFGVGFNAADPESGVSLDDIEVFVLDTSNLALKASVEADDFQVEGNIGPITMTAGNRAETGTQCENAVDDDDGGSGPVNEGCPSDGTPETGAECNNAVDDDDGGGGPVNEGCPGPASAGLAAEFGLTLTDPSGSDGKILLSEFSSGVFSGGLQAPASDPVGCGSNNACATLPLFINNDFVCTVDLTLPDITDVSGLSLSETPACNLADAISGAVIDLLLLESGLGELLAMLENGLNGKLFGTQLPLMGNLGLGTSFVEALRQDLQDTITGENDAGAAENLKTAGAGAVVGVVESFRDNVANALIDPAGDGDGPGARSDRLLKDRDGSCKDGVDNGDGDGFDQDDPDCHTDGDETNAGSYSETLAEDAALTVEDLDYVLICDSSTNPPTECGYGPETECTDSGDTTFEERDDDSDGKVNDGCASQGSTPETDGCGNAFNGDLDDDGLINDGCPAQGASEASCEDGIDNGGDGPADIDDSDCHTDGDETNAASYDPDLLEDGVNNCNNDTDDDGDGKVNDGCPTAGSTAEGPDEDAVCDNDTNDDPNDDTFINDGCPEENPEGFNIEEVRFFARIGTEGGVAQDINFQSGLPGLGLTSSGSGINLGYNWEIDLGFGISKDHGFFLLTESMEDGLSSASCSDGDDDDGDGFTDGDDPDCTDAELTVGGGVDLGSFTQASPLTAELAFLQIDISDNHAGRDAGADFKIDLLDPNSDDERLTFAEILSAPSFGSVFQYDLDAFADLDLEIVTSIEGDATLPRLLTNLVVNWTWDIDGAGDPNAVQGSAQTDCATGGADPDNCLEIAFNNLRLDVGTFLNQFLRPIVEDVQKFTEPLQPTIDVLTTEIPVLSDLSGQSITLLSLLISLGDGDLDMIDDIAAVIDFVNSFDFDAIAEGGLVIPIGDTDPGNGSPNGGRYLLVGQNLTKPLPQASDAFQVDPATRPDLQNDLVEDIREGEGAASGATAQQKNTLSGLQKLTEEAGVRFPFLEEPSQMLFMMFGKDADLVIWEPPNLKTTFAYSQKFGPIWAVPPVFVHIGGSVTLEGHLAIGYDTQGIRSVIGGADTAALLQGVFLGDRNKAGTDVPELALRGELLAGASVSAVIFSVGAEGGIFLTIGIDLVDPNGDGKVKFVEIADIVEITGTYFCIFSLEGEFGVFLRVFAEVDLFFWSQRWTKTLAEVVLLSFELECDLSPNPVLAHADGNALVLNMGPHSGARNAFGSIVDEEFSVMKDPATGAIIVTAFGISQCDWNGDGECTSADGNFDVVRAEGGSGDDKIAALNATNKQEGGGGVGSCADETDNDGDGLVDEGIDLNLDGDFDDTDEFPPDPDCAVTADTVVVPFDIKVEFDGGDDNDNLLGGTAGDLLRGGPGNDTITGGPGDNDIIGGTGSDELAGGPDVDFILGDEGTITRPDVTLGASGPNDNDNIDGGLGADKIWGQDGNDNIVGGVTETGGQTDDADEIHGGPGADTIDAGDGDDDVFGDEGRDNINGSGGNDTIHGGDETSPGDILLGGPGADHIFGGQGDDVIIGEGGSDPELHGDEGDDIILGDKGEVDFKGTDNRFDDIVILIPGEEGDDVLQGGEGRDWLFGQAGNDELDGDDDSGATPDGADDLIGGPGEDTLLGRGDVDILLGDTGSVDHKGSSTRSLHVAVLQIAAGDGDDIMDGGAGNDQLFGQGANDDLVGGDNNDTLRGGSGIDFMLGDRGSVDRQGSASRSDDEADLDGSGTPGTDSMFGDSGNDRMWGQAQSDTMRGGPGEDYMEGNQNPDASNPDTMFGGANDDHMIGGSSAEGTADDRDVMDGEAGDDIMLGDNGTIVGSVVTLLNLNPIGGDDLMNGGLGNDDMYGGPGDDEMHGNAGDDYMEGNNDSDTMTGDADQDDMIGGTSQGEGGVADAGDHITGGSGHDVMAGDNAAITRPGGDATFNDFNGSVVRTIELFDVNSLDGSLSGGDIMSGDDGDDIIYGQGNDDDTDDDGDGAVNEDPVDGVDNDGDGHTDEDAGGDFIHGNAGDDYIEGNAGADWLYGDAGQDDLIGGTGRTDTSDDASATDGRLDGGDTIFGGDGTGTAVGDDFDVMTGDNATIDRPLVGGLWQINSFNGGVTRAVWLYDVGEVGSPAGAGTSGPDVMFGEANDDIMYGQGNDDDMSGGDGDDYMEGNDGSDAMAGNAGNDDMAGGTGRINDDPPSGINGRLDEGEIDMTGNDGFDFMAGDNAIIARVLVDGAWQQNTFNGGVQHQTIILLDVNSADKALVSGGDIMSGNADDDVMYGQGNGTDADDDGDGLIDEDPVDGIDNDGDGEIDEDPGGDFIHGNDGEDYIEGNHGADFIFGDAGQDDLIGGTGRIGGDPAEGTDGRLDGDDSMFGESGPDQGTAGGSGADAMAGDNAIITRPLVDSGPNAGEWWVNVSNGAYQRSFKLLDVETLTNPVSANVHGEDEMWGNDNDDIMYGQGGGDEMHGNAGQDYMEGNAGGDTMSGDAGQDDMLGGTGPTTSAGQLAELTNDERATAVDGRLDGDDTMYGESGEVEGAENGDGADVMLGDNGTIERPLIPVPLADAGMWTVNTFNGNYNRAISLLDVETLTNPISATVHGDDEMWGNDNDDIMYGQGGEDEMHGGAGHDYMEGNAASDVMFGDSGQDDMIGGTGPTTSRSQLTELGTEALASIAEGRTDESTANRMVPLGVNMATVPLGDTMHGGTGADNMVGDNGTIERPLDNGQWIGFEYSLQLDSVGDLDPRHPAEDPVAATGARYDRNVGMIDLTEALVTANPILVAGSDLMFGDDGDDDMYGQLDDTHVAEPATGLTAEATSFCSNGIDDDGDGTADDGCSPNIGDEMHGGDGEDAMAGDQGLFSNTVLPIGSQQSIAPQEPFIEDDVFIDNSLFREFHLAQITGFDKDGTNDTGGDDRMRGGSGADSMHGGAGRDLMNGDEGNDILFGDNGDDTMWGGLHHDHLWGGFNHDHLDVHPVVTEPDALTCTKPSAPINPAMHDPLELYTFGFAVGDTTCDGNLEDVDYMYGGWNQDTMQANVADNGPHNGDRLIDWVGVHNLYILCPSTYGEFVTTREFSPAITEFMHQLAEGDGAFDPGPQDGRLPDPDPSGFNEIAFVYRPDLKDNANPPHEDTPGHFAETPDCVTP